MTAPAPNPLLELHRLGVSVWLELEAIQEDNQHSSNKESP